MPTDTWLNYSQIKFRKDDVIWILQNADTLRDGRWPPEHVETGYSKVGSKPRFLSEAPFVKSIIIIAVIAKRLSKTGIDGKLLCAEINGGAIYLSEESKHALNYCSGWREKKTAYSQYKAIRNYRAWIKQER